MGLYANAEHSIWVNAWVSVNEGAEEGALYICTTLVPDGMWFPQGIQVDLNECEIDMWHRWSRKVANRESLLW